jgi:hypothetical protein
VALPTLSTLGRRAAFQPRARDASQAADPLMAGRRRSDVAEVALGNRCCYCYCCPEAQRLPIALFREGSKKMRYFPVRR